MMQNGKGHTSNDCNFDQIQWKQWSPHCEVVEVLNRNESF